MINWRKGLFRFWIVIATFWIISIGVFSYDEYNKASKKESKLKHIVSEIKNPEKALERIDKEFPELTQGYRFKDLGPVSKEELEKLAQQSPKSGVVPPKVIPADDCDQILLEAICKSAENDRKDRLYRILLFSFIPPILLFIIGTSIYWTLRGFRT